MDLSIVIVNWNTRDILRDCLLSVYDQTSEIEYEVIVIDNASIDDSVSMVRAEFPQVYLIENSENRGFAAANNQGMEIAKGQYVLLLNSDTIILDNAISKTLEFAKDRPNAAVVGCRVLNADKSLQPTCFMFPSLLNLALASIYLYKIFRKNRFFGRELMTWWNRDDIREVDVVDGCFMLVRREAYEQVGGTDEQFFMYSEETDWCYRFKQAGWKNIFAPIAEIVHLGGQSSRQVAGKMALQLRGSVLQFCKKHYSPFTYRLACFLMLIFFVVRIPMWFIKWTVSTRNRAYCRLRMKIYVIGAWRLISGGWRSLCVNSCKL